MNLQGLGIKEVQQSHFVPDTPVLRCSRVPLLIRCRIALSTKQIAMAIYGESEYSRWKAQTDLKKLYDAKMVRRGRCMITKDYFYYVGKQPEFPDHTLLVNWVWLALHKTGHLEAFNNEYDIGGLVPDAYFIYKGLPYFLELHHMRNEFDKVKPYTEHYQLGMWAGTGWPGGNRYAVVVVAAMSQADRDWIQKIIDRENTARLRFKVLLFKEIMDNPGVIEWGS